MIIALSGKIGSGKDLVGKIIQYLTSDLYKVDGFEFTEWLNYGKTEEDYDNTWKVVKFADKLKDIVCILLNCTREQLEDRDFKEKELGEEWWYYVNSFGAYIPYVGHTLGSKTHLVKLTPRLMLQLIGTECMREVIHPNVWVNALMSKYLPAASLQLIEMDFGKSDYVKEVGNPIPTGYPNWIITDMRFPNELNAVRSKSGINIRINRNCPECNGNNYHKLSCSKQFKIEHPSEIALDKAEFDYIIDNDSTIEELIEKVKDILIKEKLL